MEKYQIAIIGGGAAGLFAAAYAVKYIKEHPEFLSSGSLRRIVLLEKEERCGRKINITGKGRCNITNTRMWDEFAPHIHPQSNFLRSAFYSMSTADTMNFFEGIGLPLVVERGQRVYPKSMRAADVTDALMNYISVDFVKVFTRCPVEKIEKDEGAFVISAKCGKINADNIIITTGGLSYPLTGSTGDGYKFAESFGHSVEKCFPSLTALVPKNYFQDLKTEADYSVSSDRIFSQTGKSLNGLELKNVSAKLIVNGAVAQEEFGDVNFTDGGIEGPIIFRISRRAVENIINGQKVQVVLDLKPALSLQQLNARIEREMGSLSSVVYGRYQAKNSINSSNPNTLRYLLNRMLPKQLIKPFMDMSKDLSVKTLPERLKELKFEIVSFVGYDRCVVTAGGISLKEVSHKTMESKLVKGLYFAGEVLDLDGDTGGYNLQTAFSTGALAMQNCLNGFAKKSDSSK
ncbi:MAG: aminoacetone oxidase family FAD-binding enzyme [Bacteroidales bacterium]|jgi:predicted Rossmann fold flavoprotein|nr:aminoacetone oxidase family FAD-binding enzyme [Bacteroidales bacterium]